MADCDDPTVIRRSCHGQLDQHFFCRMDKYRWIYPCKTQPGYSIHSLCLYYNLSCNLVRLSLPEQTQLEAQDIQGEIWSGLRGTQGDRRQVHHILALFLLSKADNRRLRDLFRLKPDLAIHRSRRIWDSRSDVARPSKAFCELESK